MKRSSILIAVLVAGVVAIGAYAQDKPASPAGTTMHEHEASGAMAGMKGSAMGSMMAEDKAMMTERQKMMAEMDAADARLADLVARMKTAEGPPKIDAMASVIGELVAQRKQMRGGMMSMGPEMMKHMMAHMKSGTVAGMEKSMAMCPMMQGSDSPKAGESDHAGHHPGGQK